MRNSDIRLEASALTAALALLGVGMVAHAQECPEECCALCDDGWVVTEGAIGDHFGDAVALDGIRLVVGAKDRNESPDVDVGKAYVFDYDEGVWDTVTELQPADFDGHEFFGASVAIDGDYILVGARGVSDIEDSAGAAYVFDGGDSWDETELTHPNPKDFDYFGTAVAIYGDIAVVGAPGVNDNEGAAFIFDAGESWDLVAVLTASDGTKGDGFGVSVAIDGDVIVIGADNTGDGAAYVFEEPGNGWDDMTETAKLTPSDSVGDDAFGYSVSISGDRIAVGAWQHDQGGNQGAVYLFEDSDGWNNHSQSATLVACDIGGPVDFGFSVAIDGPVLVVGARLGTSGEYGTAHVFRYFSGLDDWEFMNALYPIDGASSDHFGHAVAIRGGLAVVGSPMHTETTSAGAIYEFDAFSIAGDANEDTVVDIVDFLDMLAQWGSCAEPCPPSCSGDANGDCNVNVSDFLLILSTWGNVYGCGGTEPLTLGEELEDACLSQADWTSYVGVMMDPESSQEDKDNYDCWMWYYLFDCDECNCEGNPDCPGNDPYN